jgi:glycosyltransferase involved in cell wall biosynthesis
MRIALVTSSYGRERHGVGGHVRQLARGLARRGATVEIIAPAVTGLPMRGGDENDVVVRRFWGVTGPIRIARSSELRERIQTVARSFDVADVHSTHSAFALAATRAGFRSLAFTAHAPVDRLLGWPHAHATRAMVAAAQRIACGSEHDRERLCARFPGAADRFDVIRRGVDVEAIRAVDPLPPGGTVVFSPGPPLRSKRIDRTIAAMGALCPDIRLLIAGRGPDRHRLQAYADDLRVSSQVTFTGSLTDSEYPRWLRTASVVTVLDDESGTGVDLLEAVAAGAHVIASDTPIHRELVDHLGGHRVTLIGPRTSPLTIAESIQRATPHVADVTPAQFERVDVPTWDDTVDAALALYERVIESAPLTLARRGTEGTRRLGPRRSARVAR